MQHKIQLFFRIHRGDKRLKNKLAERLQLTSRTFLTPPLSLMTTTSSGEFSRPCQQRRKLRPMRPNPLIATLSFASAGALTPFSPVACHRLRNSGSHSVHLVDVIHVKRRFGCASPTSMASVFSSFFPPWQGTDPLGFIFLYNEKKFRL
jgi:hypothetical protein